MFDIFGNNRSTKRSLGTRDKQILLQRAGRKCENCGKRLNYESMMVGHKNAWSKGGSTTLRNSVALCYPCNKLQGTDDWTTFQRKQGKAPAKNAKVRVKTHKRRRQKRGEWGIAIPDLLKGW